MGIARGIMCAHVVKLGWDTRTNLYAPCTWYIAAELQYSRNEVHVMMVPLTVTRAQYVASTEDIAPNL